MINVPFNDLNHTIHHKFLRNLASVKEIPRIFLVHPHLYNSLLIYANILLLNCEKTNLLGQILKPSQALGKDMQKIGERHVLNIRQPDGYLLEVQFLDMAGGAQLILGFGDKVATGYQVGMILSKQIHLSLLFMLLIIRRIDGVLLDPLRWVPAAQPDLQELEGVHELPILGLESLASGVALIVSHHFCYYFEQRIKIIISYTFQNQKSLIISPHLAWFQYYYHSDNKLIAVQYRLIIILSVKSMQHQQPLFSFCLRIEKKMSKLNIYEDDNLEDVLDRFGKLVKLKRNFQGKIKEKLENQLRRFVSERECSAKVREKIESFLEESKVVIIGISQTEHYEEPVKRGPEKVEQESCRFAKRIEKEPIKLSYPASHDVSPVLSKYFTKEILVEQPQEEKSTEEIQYKTANRTRDNRDYESFLQPSQNYHHNYNTSDFNIKKGNEPLADIDKIIRNRIARSQQRQMRVDMAKSKPQRKFSATPAQNKYDQPKLASYESYQGYKQSKRDNYITKQPSRQRINPHCIQSKEYLQSSQKINTIKHPQTNSLTTKFDYERCLQAKGVTGGFKENKKFQYIS